VDSPHGVCDDTVAVVWLVPDRSTERALMKRAED
jgi:hypothetical protein